MDIIFSESVVNFDWNKILNEVKAQIRNDHKHFLDDGGWDFLQPSGSEDGGVDEEEMEEGDSVFEASEEEESVRNGSNKIKKAIQDEASESDFSGEGGDDDDDDESDFDGGKDIVFE